jgi:hypothetical protein
MDAEYARKLLAAVKAKAVSTEAWNQIRALEDRARQLESDAEKAVLELATGTSETRRHIIGGKLVEVTQDAWDNKDGTKHKSVRLYLYDVTPLPEVPDD